MVMVLPACEADLLFNIVEKGCSRTLEAINDHMNIPLTTIQSVHESGFVIQDLYHDRAM
jgi:hypothetical protein